MRSINGLLNLCVLTLFASCGSVKSIKIAEIQSISLEYNPEQGLNYGSTFNGRIVAILTNGEEVDVTENKKTEFLSDDIIYLGQNQFLVSKHPKSFTDQYAAYRLRMSDKDEEIQKSDSLLTNYLGTLNILAGGKDGQNGHDQGSAGSGLVFRNGKNGSNGTNGANGESTAPFEAYIWKDGSVIKIYMKNMISGEVWKYNVVGNGKIQFDLSGGDGGKGGNGGDGGNGKDGKVKNGETLTPGDGGDGGQGGNGGNGGNGGQLKVYLYPDCQDLQDRFTFDVSAGAAGGPGLGGAAGKPGSPLSGQNEGANGTAGNAGQGGTEGNNGPVPVIIVQEFNFNNLL